MRIGIFGGSFDPVHQEHIHLAQAAIKGLALDELIIMPAGIPPHKQGKRLAPAADRLAMCKFAFQDIKEAEISDYEIQNAEQGEVSYTYLTCRYFSEKYPNAQLFWLVGTDMFYDFFHWKNPDIILSYATLAVCRRSETEDNTKEKQRLFFERFQKEFAEIPYNGAAVSSTEIRARVGLGMSCGNLVTPAVAGYIAEHELYKNPLIDEGLSLEKPSRAEHSKRVCLLAVKKAEQFHIDKNKAFLAGALHDVAKNLPLDDKRLQGFVPPKDVPMPVLHQFSGAYVLEHAFGVTDEDILNAVRYHTSGRAGMSDLEKLIFLADLLEEARDFPHVEELRAAFDRSLNECMRLSLEHQVKYLQEQGGEIYPLTLQAYEYYKEGR
ncbi:MAG: nicotinate (nicotinamide) nucleotide adenylyltransferase [Clostridia bacterium]|nr:nicotinate (nicotinamide) nucleotide adenylyltransferase [Clostridia bacterium]